ncbi:glutathione binding-like protein, partial [Sinorhizobium meliloti]
MDEPGTCRCSRSSRPKCRSPSFRSSFLEDEAEQSRLREILSQRFRWVASRLEGDFLFDGRFTGADAFLYVMLRWGAMVGLETPGIFEAFVEAVESRGA